MEPLITIIATSYMDGSKVNIFCDTLLNQYVPINSWKAVILHDGANQDFVQRVDPYFRQYPDNFDWYSTSKRANQWGHNLRAQGLEMASDEGWITFQNVDNQFCYGWLERVIPVLRQSDPDLVLWNSSHSYVEFDLFTPELQTGKIDFCNFMVRASMMKELGFPWRNFEADGSLIEALIEKYPNCKIERMSGVFATHN
jgi:hypothetical protein